MTDYPRRFRLQRTTDITGVSGTGRVADGILWPDGTASVRWTGEHPSIVFWDGGIADAEHVHGHGGHTVIVWDDPEPAAPGDCEHCPDGHTPADSGTQPWGVYVAVDRDGDGQPTHLIVARSGGAHVAESDAQWIRDRLNGPNSDRPAPPPESTFSRLGRGA
ncbi:hypothetical protein ACIQNU_04380 [Streptomyces sp. NPDC091292]|uniref:hypothetical protein n=1 Tax=Streptomyces sp. NPDC091292 TaxID=3365991 RepID=UPI0037F5E490